MNILGDGVRWLLAGGHQHRGQVEDVMSGELQARYAHRGRRSNSTLIHPNYQLSTIAATESGIRGAFTLRLIGLEGKPYEELEAYGFSDEAVPNLEHIGGDPVTYKMLGVMASTHLLKSTKIVEILNGFVNPRELGTDMLTDYPVQAKTILPTVLGKLKGQDIGGEYSSSQYRGDKAADIYQQYSQYYPNVRPVE